MSGRTFFTVAVLCGFASTAVFAADGLEIGQKAPDFKLTSSEGSEISFSDFKGKVVVLQWTNHTCPFIKRHEGTQHTVQKLVEKFESKGVAFVAVDSSYFCEEKKDGINAFRKENGLKHPTLLDASGKIGKMFGAKTTPHVFVFGKDGKLIYKGGFDNDRRGDKENARNYVAEAISAALNGSTPPVEQAKPYGCGVKYAK